MYSSIAANYIIPMQNLQEEADIFIFSFLKLNVSFNFYITEVAV